MIFPLILVFYLRAITPILRFLRRKSRAAAARGRIFLLPAENGRAAEFCRKQALGFCFEFA
ncbi:MAG: hypothetical protein DU429_07890 [Candidatus Tokpelaia sp.]|nr:MAG: hypothetical protein DU430_08095 [Candidatus Tokpelaia sp.]KAA6205542.1 MAG: hypothetical protein DU429_07890 [Candidatus Tokpelaia sp.]KAA6405595.1 hypothetical protein DPQ22_03955 [Candidatus Tokpelaia sp.]